MPNSILGNNLVDKLVPMVDGLRASLYPSMGTRQYRVTIVRRTWDGGEIGAGTPTVESSVEILPQPLVESDESYRLDERAGCGLVDAGTATLTEVSLTWTEAELLGLPTAPGTETYYEITDAHGQGIAATTWIPAAPPEPDREKGIGWIVKLRRYEAM